MRGLMKMGMNISQYKYQKQESQHLKPEDRGILNSRINFDIKDKH